MSQSVPESDWKLFRRLREVALTRFCESTLKELEAICTDELRASPERFRDAYSLLDRRNEEIARLFDDPRRSTMLLQLSLISRYQLLEISEFTQFSSTTRERLQGLHEALNP